MSTQTISRTQINRHKPQTVIADFYFGTVDLGEFCKECQEPWPCTTWQTYEQEKLINSLRKFLRESHTISIRAFDLQRGHKIKDRRGKVYTVTGTIRTTNYMIVTVTRNNNNDSAETWRYDRASSVDVLI